MPFATMFRVAAVAMLSCLTFGAAAEAENPYFAPYGSHRGRIHIGPRHARIRWGGGLTQYGAAVLIHGFDVAGSVGRAYVGGGTGDDSGSVGSESATENEAKCHEQLKRTQELLEETKRACRLGYGEAQPEASPEPGDKPVAPQPEPYSRIEDVKRQVEASLPLIDELQKVTAERKKATEDFEKVLSRDRKAFEAFVNAYQSP